MRRGKGRVEYWEGKRKKGKGGERKEGEKRETKRGIRARGEVYKKVDEKGEGEIRVLRREEKERGKGRERKEGEERERKRGTPARSCGHPCETGMALINVLAGVSHGKYQERFRT